MDFDKEMLGRMIGPDWPVSRSEKDLIAGAMPESSSKEDAKKVVEWLSLARITVQMFECVKDGTLRIDKIENGQPLFVMTDRCQKRAEFLINRQRNRDITGSN